MPRPRFRLAGSRRRFVFAALATALLLGAARDLDAQRRGVRAELGPFIARPFLDDRSHEPFAVVGRFRAGPGFSVGLGYDLGSLGATATGEVAGLEIGPLRERNGIGMGRRTATLTSVGVYGHWAPDRSVVGWVPRLSLGYVRQVIGNLTVQATELPDYLRDADSALPAEGELVLAGAGARAGIGLARTLSLDCSACLGVRIELATDLSRFPEARYAGAATRVPEPGRGFTPRLSMVAEWLP